MKVILVVLALCAVALAQRTAIDDFVVAQPALAVNGLDQDEAIFVLSSNIYGGRRDTSLDLDSRSVATCGDIKQSAGCSVSENGFLDADGDLNNDNPGDLGIFIAANDQSCFAKTLITYAGSLGTGFSGSQSNFNSIGSAIRFLYYSDISNRLIIARVVSGAGSCETTLRTTGNQFIDDKTIAFTAFTGTCDFSAVTRFEIEIPAQSNFDVTISLFEFVSGSLSGRVFNDCGCNGTFDAATDTGVSGLTVTATPGSGCATGTPSATTSTNADGSYRFNSLAACSFTVSLPAGSNACTASRTATVSLGSETTNINFGITVPSTLVAPGPITLPCGSSLPATTATLTSSCGDNIITQFTQTTQPAVCPVGGNTARNQVTTRTFTAAGQTVTQTITVEYDQEDPTYTNPPDIVLSCSQFPSDPTVTAIPMSLAGFPDTDDDCSNVLTPTFFDDIDESCDTTLCGASFIIQRSFIVTDACGNVATTLGATQRIERTACSTTSSFFCPIQSVCGVNPPPPPPPNVPPPPPQTGDCNGNTNSRTTFTNTIDNGGSVDTNSLTTNTNSRSTVTSDDFTGASAFTNSRTTLSSAENLAGNTNTKTTITSDDFTGATAITNSRTSLTNSENYLGSPTPNTSNDSPLAVDSTANSPNESPNASPNASNSGDNASTGNNNSPNNNNSSNNNNNSSATSLAASLVALVALFFLF